MSTIFLHSLESGLFTDIMHAFVVVVVVFGLVAFVVFFVMKRYNVIGENETWEYN